MDDILIFSKDLEEHRILVKKVLQWLEEEDLFLKLEKCFFEKPSIEYLGMIISQDKIQMDPAKLSVVLDWPTPKCVKDVQSFLGFGNFYQRFIQGFANIMAPLTALTQKDTTWLWNDDQQKAFNTLKQRFTLAPILLMPDFSKPFWLETDASDYNYGAILSQQSDDGHWLPVAYMSKQMLPAEHNYVIYNKELLTIIEALKIWCHYLEGSPHPVEIWSNHKNLEYFRSAQSLNCRQARWSLFLSCFQFTISHHAGTLNRADHLTQRSDHQEGVEFDNLNTMVLHPSIFRVNTTGQRSPAPKKTLRDVIRESA